LKEKSEQEKEQQDVRRIFASEPFQCPSVQSTDVHQVMIAQLMIFGLYNNEEAMCIQ
jgi:hypothetical protein